MIDVVESGSFAEFILTTILNHIELIIQETVNIMIEILQLIQWELRMRLDYIIKHID